LTAVRSHFLTVTAALCLISHQRNNVFTVLHLHLSGSLKFELETIPREIEHMKCMELRPPCILVQHIMVTWSLTAKLVQKIEIVDINFPEFATI
jgi:hypothetical protein